MCYDFYALQVEKLPEVFSKLKQYIKYNSSRGFSFLVGFLGKFNEDGLVMENKSTIPVHIIEGQMKKFMEESEEPCPMTVFLAFFPEAGGKVQMSKIVKEKIGEEPQRFLLKE